MKKRQRIQQEQTEERVSETTRTTTSGKEKKKKRKAASAIPVWMQTIRASTVGSFATVKEKDNQSVVTMLTGMRYGTRPAPCEWLSRETHILPPVVNIVYTTNFKSPCFEAPLDLVRFAQYLPNAKYKPRFAAISIRLWPTTMMLYMTGKATIIKATSRWMAIRYMHLYRQLIEQVPIQMVVRDDPLLSTPHVGTLEGYLGCQLGNVENIVASGALPQDGVHLTRLLLDNNDETVDYDLSGFVNLFYHGRLANGARFCANIAITGKVVLMGLNTLEGVHEAYKITCDKVHNFDDPNVPSDPKERHKYRFRQLMTDPHFTTADGDINFEDAGDGDDDDDVDADDGNGPKNPFAKILAGMDAFVPSINIGTNDASNNNANPVVRVKEDEDEQPLLFQAALAGQLENVKFMLKSGMAEQDIRRVDPQGNCQILALIRALPVVTPAHVAVMHLLEHHLTEDGYVP